MKILRGYKSHHLEIIEKSNPSTKDLVLEVFELSKDDSKILSDLSDLNDINPSNILFIDLSNQGLKSIPDVLYKFVNLRGLDLSNNPLVDFSALERCNTSLQVLFVENCELDRIPDELFRFRKLTSFNFNDNLITEYNKDLDLGEFPNLTSFNLSNNLLESLPNSIFRSDNLVGVYIDNNNIQELPTGVFDLEKIYELRVYSNPLREIDAKIGTLTSLRILDLDHTEFVHVPDEISNLANLEKLFINSDYVKQINGSVFSLKNLTVLNIGGGKINNLDANFSKLTNLVNLTISCRKLNSISKSLCGLPKVRLLTITGGKNLDFRKLDFTMPALKYLTIKNSKIYEFPGSFKSCKGLKEVTITGNEIKEITDDISNLNELEELSFTNNKIEKISKNIGLLRSLNFLSLYGNKLEELPLEISNLKKLTALYIKVNPFSKMKEIENMGVDELFRYFDRIRGVGDYVFDWEMPEEIRTAFQQYLIFFSEFYEKMNNRKLLISVNKIETGLRCAITTDEDSNIDSINDWLKIYLQIANTSTNAIGNDSKNDFESELFKLKLETQILHLNQQLRQANFEVKYLKTVVDKFFDLQEKSILGFRSVGGLIESSKEPEVKFVDKVNTLVKNGSLEPAIELLLIEFRDRDDKLNYDDSIILLSKLTRVMKENRLGLIDRSVKEIELSKIGKSILHLAKEN